MIRDELDLSREPRSWLLRAVLLVSTLAVVLIASWVFTPILLANYSAFTATLRARPVELQMPQAQKPAAPAATVAVAPATVAPAVPPSLPAPTSDTTAVASAVPAADDAAPPPAPAVAPAPSPFDTTASTPWPTNPPAMPAPSSTAAASTDSMRLAAIAAENAATDRVGENIPLPHARPSRLIAARLAIPLPRPRPEIESDEPTPDEAAFDLQVERMR